VLWNFRTHAAARCVSGKVSSKMSDKFQAFLDECQYTRDGIKRYEWIFGETFLSSGGLDTTQEIVATLGIKAGDRILDIGCGIGGHDFYMAEHYDVEVHAVDLSTNMMAIALEHFHNRPHLKNKIRFEICDITGADFEENSFEIVYSRDTLLHIADKEQLFKKIFKWLSPGGKVVFTDYGQSNQTHGQEFLSYVAQRKYHLFTIEDYQNLLKSCGFTAVKAENTTDKWKTVLLNELNRLKTQREDFLKRFSEEDFGYLKKGWEAKLSRVDEGDQIWIYGYAQKPN